MADKKKGSIEPHSGSNEYMSIDYQSWLKAHQMPEYYATIVTVNTDGEKWISFVKQTNTPCIY